jgi:hypothetical protein
METLYANLRRLLPRLALCSTSTLDPPSLSLLDDGLFTYAKLGFRAGRTGQMTTIILLVYSRFGKIHFMTPTLSRDMDWPGCWQNNVDGWKPLSVAG